MAPPCTALAPDGGDLPRGEPPLLLERPLDLTGDIASSSAREAITGRLQQQQQQQHHVSFEHTRKQLLLVHITQAHLEMLAMLNL